MSRLFVYGTLRRGQENHWRLHGAQRVGTATLPHWRRADLGDSPDVRPATNAAVPGEMYDVPQDVLAAIDTYEKPYTRRRGTLSTGETIDFYDFQGDHMPADEATKAKLMDVLKSHGVDDPEGVVSAIYDAGLVVESKPGEASEGEEPPGGELPMGSDMADMGEPHEEVPEAFSKGKMPQKEARGFAVEIALGKKMPFGKGKKKPEEKKDEDNGGAGGRPY